MNEIETAIGKIKDFGAPVGSYVEAGAYMNNNLPALTDAKALIQTLTNKSCSERGKDERYVPTVAAYVVMLTVKAHLRDQSLRMFDILTESKVSADKFLEEMAWSFVEGETKAEIENVAPELVIAGRAKKGAKKVLGAKVFAAKIKGKVQPNNKADLTAELTMYRKGAIAILMEEVGLTSSGASTYYHNFQPGQRWAV